MKIAVAIVAIMAVAALAEVDLTAPAMTQELIDAVNSNPTSSWVAGVNARFQGLTLQQAARQMGVKKNGIQLPMKKVTSQVHLALPTAFDSRVQWGTMCPVTKHVRDQGACGSCWAFGAVEAMTDRICIHSKGSNTAYLSAEDLVSCCDQCGDGCSGGDPGSAWDYWQSTGIVTGGDYNSSIGCYPYQVAACDHHVVGHLPPCGNEGPTPPCEQTCANGANWNNDLHYGASSYQVGPDQNSIMTEIMTNGPVEAAFTVYADFLTYKSGVYVYKSGAELGGHAIKILGWGVENGLPYWTVANSWNTDWGNAGYFNILRGQDECGIEDDVCAGMPK
jgi:cathepsin B